MTALAIATAGKPMVPATCELGQAGQSADGDATEAVEPPPVSPVRGPPTEWSELVQAHDGRDGVQASPDELPVADIHSL